MNPWYGEKILNLAESGEIPESYEILVCALLHGGTDRFRDGTLKFSNLED